MKIGQREIGEGHPPYIVAEISGNHNGSLEYAKELIRMAKWAGADAVKSQCYEPDTITLNIRKPDFIIQDGLWKGRTLYDLYSKSYTPFRWHPQLYKLAEELGITIFSSVFDYSSIQLLEKLGCPAYKIASMEIVDLPLIQRAASTGKPLIISTGMATDEEILEANVATGDVKAAFLHCTSEYPAVPEKSQLRRIDRLRQLLPEGSLVGISDHTKRHIVPIAATALGACIIEKHLRLEAPSEDSEFSLYPTDFKEMVIDVRATWMGMNALWEEEPNPSRQLRRSLYAVQDIAEGETFTVSNVRSIRPGYGIPPKMLPRILGKRSHHRYKRGDRITMAARD